MVILQADTEQRGKFYVEVEGKEVATMTYFWSGTGRMVIEHTEVDEILKGKNAGKQLLMKVVSLARENGYRITPVCPFARKMFEKIPEIRDVL